jgi:hypothetical protein
MAGALRTPILKTALAASSTRPPDRGSNAFTDHAAELCAGSGNDCLRALAFSRMNAANRPTHRATNRVGVISANSDRDCKGERFAPAEREKLRIWPLR